MSAKNKAMNDGELQDDRAQANVRISKNSVFI